MASKFMTLFLQQLYDLVFHVATPVNFASEDPENDMIKPAIQGVVNVLKACAKAGTVKPAVVSINQLNGTGLVMDEGHWSDVEFLSTAKPPTSGYPVSKTLAEKAAWKIAAENNIDLITVIPSLVTGPSLTQDIPRNEFLVNAMNGMQMLLGSISITHVEDMCRAHIFVAEKESPSGRYICSAVNTSVPKLANFDDFPSKPKLTISSEELINREIYDQTVAFLKDKGILEFEKLQEDAFTYAFILKALNMVPARRSNQSLAASAL
ncbi:hypothetical protein RJ640_002758 [Escallonia rubra]|uniref:NAD-dependent epimerase/dehydratase domain-containing protein n=1 Tax=Escallonia rubra TaxID=112253 RepID=A0AA88USM6_9ASTE|nr:hypothetical protein RJ640_002758 [Escallonia rubra]